MDINEAIIKNFVESLRPKELEIRKQLDYGYSYDGKEVILFEIRPVWNNPDEIQHQEFAKLRFIKTRKQWELYWMRASGKWQHYAPFPKSAQIDELIKAIKDDSYGCFFG
ncbi:DUF3024 domain-containing protein [Galbibacter sp.]|uniref:DUF3024 domain-containing protein n=1 Tax=Galbibacter sp. TaxID=2918471 RepID=UPI003A8EB306